MWVRLDDGFMDHPKARAVGKDGRELYISGLCRVAQLLSDGFIPDHELPLVAAKAEVRPKPTATKLVNVGLWERVDGGWLIHDYHDYNPTAEAEREKRRKRAEAGRKGGLRSRPPARNGQAAAEANASANAPPNGEVDAQADGQPTAPAGAEAPANPVPVFPLGNTTGQQQQTAEDGRGRESAAAALGAVVEVLLRARGKHQAAAKADDPDAYLATVRRAITAEVAPAVAQLRNEHPDWDFERIAEAVDEHRGTRLASVPAGPVPGAGCERCDGNGVYELPGQPDVFDRCDHQLHERPDLRALPGGAA